MMHMDWGKSKLRKAGWQTPCSKAYWVMHSCFNGLLARQPPYLLCLPAGAAMPRVANIAASLSSAGAQVWAIRYCCLCRPQISRTLLVWSVGMVAKWVESTHARGSVAPLHGMGVGWKPGHISAPAAFGVLRAGRARVHDVHAGASFFQPRTPWPRLVRHALCLTQRVCSRLSYSCVCGRHWRSLQDDAVAPTGGMCRLLHRRQPCGMFWRGLQGACLGGRTIRHPVHCCVCMGAPFKQAQLTDAALLPHTAAAMLL